jgi:hypothetical protein
LDLLLQLWLGAHELLMKLVIVKSSTNSSDLSLRIVPRPPVVFAAVVSGTMAILPSASQYLKVLDNLQGIDDG